MEKYLFQILEENGEIDQSVSQYASDILALQAIARFVSLFHEDEFNRVARCSKIVNGKPSVIVTYDSKIDVLTYGRK